jgi:tRNA dimethylallyltransferase
MVAPQKIDLVVIVGPTASGKSALAMRIAKEFDGEIISADSRTIYKGMDIGTAKPSSADQAEVRHWGLDLVEPGQPFSAAQFKKYALEKLEDIRSRGKLPILVGGTGLYVDSVLFDFSFVKANRVRRFIYSSWSIEKLQKIIQQKDWPMPENLQNKRHLVRVVERKGRVGFKHPSLPPGTLLVGLMPPDDILKQLIDSRAEQIFKSGIITETKSLLKTYGEKRLKLTGGIAYRFSIPLIKGELTKEEAKGLFKKADWQYARRQRTWLRRNKFIQWFGSAEEAFTSVSNILNNLSGTITP